MNKVKNWEWASHQPMINGVLEEFKPKYILELGIGDYSTPLFYNYKPIEMLSIENDREWLGSYSQFNTSYPIILHELDKEIKLGTHPCDLSEKQKSKHREYYLDIADFVKNISLYPKLLFVDQFTCLRAESINTLYPYFDIIIYHDCQPAGIDWYEYYFDTELLDTYKHYTLKTPIVWTGCFVAKHLADNNLATTILPYINTFCVNYTLNANKVFLTNE